MGLLPAYLAEQEGSVAPVGDPYWDDVVLLLEFAGQDGDTAATDYSDTPHTAFSWGNNAQILNDTLDLDGASGTAVYYNDSNDWTFDGDFTVELFGVAFDSVSSFRALIAHYQSQFNRRSWFIQWSGTNLAAGVSSDGSSLTQAVTSGFTPATDGTRYDITFERSGSTLRLYIDGVQEATSTHAGALHNSNEFMSIGAIGTSGGHTNWFDGKIQAVRITKGTARYADAGGYTVPLLPLPKRLPYDEHYNNVVLLLHFDGTNGQTTTVDSSKYAHSMTANDGANISTAQSKFGGASTYLDGGDDVWYCSDAPEFAIGTKPFTIEGWVRFDDLTPPSDRYCIASQWNTSGQRGWLFSWEPTNGLEFYWSTDGAFNVGESLFGSWTPTAGTWYHVAVDRTASGDLRLYVDGSMVASDTGVTDDLHDTNTLVRIGAALGGSLINEMQGYIDDLRITIGTARYASDAGFDVPVRAYPEGR